jgi:hypothetical protein
MKISRLFKCGLGIACAFLYFGGEAQSIQPHKINIIDFNLVIQNNKVNINWSTDNKTATNYFEVEKSQDGKNFKTVAYILGADPAKTGCDCYGCIDVVGKTKNEFYYRLKHVDTDGNVEISETRTLAFK